MTQQLSGVQKLQAFMGVNVGAAGSRIGLSRTNYGKNAMRLVLGHTLTRHVGGEVIALHSTTRPVVCGFFFVDVSRVR
jgi:hypothetical protein